MEQEKEVTIRYMCTVLILPVLILAILLLASGCSENQSDEYWISGLTLPTGSTVVSSSEELHDVDPQPGKDYTQMRTLTIMFNNPDGWKKVVAHYDKQLGSRGYRETKYSRHADKLDSLEEFERQLLDSGRFYESDRTEFAVSLSTLDFGIPGLEGEDRQELFSGGEFMMTVMELD